MLDFIREQSEKRLAAQAQLMASADSRANALLAASVALSAAAVATAVGQSDANGSPRLVWAAAAFASLTVGAAGLAVAALWPIPVHAVGWTGNSFIGDIKAGKTSRLIKAEIVAMLHARTERNRACASQLAVRVKGAMLCLSLAPPVGLAVGIYDPCGWSGVVSGCIAAGCLGFATYFGDKLRGEAKRAMAVARDT
ncbi:MAG: hypothetical protein ACK4M2_08675 [Brevundimonas sp.]|nr:hypothetical protein [Brevundimonas sp.]